MRSFVTKHRKYTVSKNKARNTMMSLLTWIMVFATLCPMGLPVLADEENIPAEPQENVSSSMPEEYPEEVISVCGETEEPKEMISDGDPSVTTAPQEPEPDEEEELALGSEEDIYVPETEIHEPEPEETVSSEPDVFAEETDMPVSMPAQSYEGLAGNILVTVEAGEGAFPQGTVMKTEFVSGVGILNTATETVDGRVTAAQGVEITFLDTEGNEIEPVVPVTVSIRSAVIESAEDTVVIHVDDAGDALVVEQKIDSDPDEVIFETPEFSLYIIVSTEIVEHVISSDGTQYRITVKYGPDAGIPEDAGLDIAEILPGSEAYLNCMAKVYEDLDTDPPDIAYARFFDISIVSGKEEVTVSAPVCVTVELEDRDSFEDLRVVHFKEEPEYVAAEATECSAGSSIEFQADGFSVYGIVDLEAVLVDESGIKDMQALEEAVNAGTPVKLFIRKNGVIQWFSSNIISNKNCYEVTESLQNAAVWTIESANGGYVIHTDSGYMKNTSGNFMGYVSSASQATVFEISEAADGHFFFKLKGSNKWLQYSNGGGGIRLWTANDDAENCNIGILNASESISDPAHLDGKSYGITVWNGGVTGKAMMASENVLSDSYAALDAKVLTVMTKSGDCSDKLYVPGNEEEEITEWTFKWVSENTYHISAGPNSQYLKITDSGLALTDDESEAGNIEVLKGQGAHYGQICLKCGDITLAYSGSLKNGFSIGPTGSVGDEWLYLTEVRSETIPDGYYRTYTAEKISIADPALSPDEPNTPTVIPPVGKPVIIYTRSWNGHGYDFFAINGDGVLIPCTESGNTIEWLGNNTDNMIWSFIEYSDKYGVRNNYYELQNEGTKQYLAPMIGTENPLRDDPIGLVIPGRREGQYYSPILVWDGAHYSYAGLKVDRSQESGSDDEKIVSCVRADCDDFYFAIVQEIDPDDGIHTVSTVDNNLYGITMKMANFDTRKQMSNFLGNDTGGITTNLVQGLLSTDLKENGYPTAKGGSLATMFSKAEEVNHLFIDSNFRATGYFEYDSAQNFATLQGRTSGDFVVYQEIGTHDASDRYTLKHGQFYPYNDLSPGLFAQLNPENVYSSLPINPGAGSQEAIHELPDSDPRKYEHLYLIENPDYFFGVELNARFEQTPSGLDDWGHDIIFEFSGDDDFWLYVDGELVIDLGGIHSSVPGSVNFRTGEVNVNGRPTTLRDLFYNNFKGRGHTDTQALEYVNGIFEEKIDPDTEEVMYVFKDNTPHEMRIFYLERGAGASNLHMRFNLAAIKKGTVQLTKVIDGVAVTNSSKYPYQVYYRYSSDTAGEYRILTNATIRTSSPYYGNWEPEGYPGISGDLYLTDYVFYRGTQIPVEFDPYLAIGDSVYNDVYFLKPDEVAEISFPKKILENGNTELVDQYYIVECGLDPNVYPHVTANTTVLPGEEAQDPRIEDYATTPARVDDRPTVTYINTVADPGTLEFTKELYRADGEKISRDPNGETFDFRLYFGSTFDPDASEAAYLFAYHVKDENGRYCRWVPTDNPDGRGTFEVITNDDYPEGTTVFENLTPDTIVNGETIRGEQSEATFDTSTNGAISQIPAYYTVEVTDLIPGTKFKIVERPSETPDGYHFWQYWLDGEQTGEESSDDAALDGVSGEISASETSSVVVRNKIGFGLRLNKIWGDEETVAYRSPTFFAVFVKGEDGDLEMVPDTVKQLVFAKNLNTDIPDDQTLGWFFEDLPVKETKLTDYAVYEVALTGDWSADQYGNVTGYTSALPVISVIPHGPDHENTVILTAREKGSDSEIQVEYDVSYGTPEIEDEHILMCDVVNTRTERLRLKFVKTDMEGEVLAGAVFTLARLDGSTRTEIGTYTSDENGVINVCDLDYGETYILTETEVPDGYIGLEKPVLIKVAVNSDSEVPFTADPQSEDDKELCVIGEEEKIPTLTVRNRLFVIEVIKVDSESEPLEGAAFELFRYEDGEGEQMAVLNPDNSGYVFALPVLAPGEYELEETKAPGGFSKLSENIGFNVGEDGTVTLREDKHTNASIELEEQDTAIYRITVVNSKLFVKIRKADQDKANLTGSEFLLERLDDEGIWQETEKIDLSDTSSATLESLSEGRYRLTEETAPEGYIKCDESVFFAIDNGKVQMTLEDGTVTNSTEYAYSTTEENVVCITVINTKEVPPEPPTPPTPPTPPAPPEPPAPVTPKTGETGITAYLISGLSSGTIGSLLAVALRRRRRNQK